jgi:DNA-binding Lrp family transcriptional regulator
VDVFDMLGPSFLATFAARSPDDVEKTVDGFVGRFRLKIVMRLGDRVTKDPLAVPDRLEWRIIQKLRHDALRPTSRIADELSITPRMVDYRISKLLESGALFVRAAISAEKQRGLVFYGLVIFVDEPRHSDLVEAVREMFGVYLWSLLTPKTGVILANLFALTPNEPEEAVMNALRLKGVKQCLLSIFKQTIEPERPNWIDRRIEGMTAGEGLRTGHRTQSSSTTSNVRVRKPRPEGIQNLRVRTYSARF